MARGRGSRAPARRDTRRRSARPRSRASARRRRARASGPDRRPWPRRARSEARAPRARRAPRSPRRSDRVTRSRSRALLEPAVDDPDMLPARPHLLRVALAREQLAEARAFAGEQLVWRAILDDDASFDDDHAREHVGLREIVGRAQHRRAMPVRARCSELPLAGLALEAAKWLVHHDEARVVAGEAAAEAHALPFAPGAEAAPFAEPGREPLRQARQHGRELRAAREVRG